MDKYSGEKNMICGKIKTSKFGSSLTTTQAGLSG